MRACLHAIPAAYTLIRLIRYRTFFGLGERTNRANRYTRRFLTVHAKFPGNDAMMVFKNRVGFRAKVVTEGVVVCLLQFVFLFTRGIT
jgi:hypothetical protein